MPASAPRFGVSRLVWILALVVFAAGIGLVVWWTRGSDGQDFGQVVTQRVTRGAFVHDVVEIGEVESSSNVEVRCEVKNKGAAGTTIIEVIPEGSVVQEGDLLVKLDSSALEQDRVSQQIAVSTAEARKVQAENLYDAALLAKREYLEGTYRQEAQLIESELFVAEENLRRAQKSMESSSRLAARGLVTRLQLEADGFAVKKAEKELASVRTKLDALEITRQKMEKQLDGEISSNKAILQAETSSYELETDKLQEIVDQIAKCTIRAPGDGQVKYANNTNSRSGNDFIVEPGVSVRERQTIIYLPDPTRMQVKAKINESRIAMVEEGMPATIKLDAFDDMELPGEVVQVNEYPEPTSWRTANVKDYAAIVKVTDPPPGMRPGMTASVIIHIHSEEDAILAPVQAVAEHGGQHYCVIESPNGYEPRPVEISRSNGKHVILVSGVDEAEMVAMNPRRMLPAFDLPEAEKEVAQASSKAGLENSSDDEKSRRQPESGPPNPAQIASRIFGELDVNGDGVLTEEEIPAERRERMVAADANGDGRIERAELLQAFQRMTRERRGEGSSAGGA